MASRTPKPYTIYDHLTKYRRLGHSGALKAAFYVFAACILGHFHRPAWFQRLFKPNVSVRICGAIGIFRSESKSYMNKPIADQLTAI